MKRDTVFIKIFAILVTLGVVLFVTPVSWEVAGYLYAIQLEKVWSKADPQTRQEMESYLSCYTMRPISPVDSDWGRNYVLGRNEKMIQYRILGSAELDVVYDRQDNVVVIFTSYE